MRNILVLVMLLFFPASLLAKDKPCSANPLVIGKAVFVKGRLSLYNGSPAARIWVVGTRRMLGVSDGRFHKDGYANLPESLKAKLDFDTDLFGDFAVYPFTRSQPGVMQLVCIEAAESLVVRPRGSTP